MRLLTRQGRDVSLRQNTPRDSRQPPILASPILLVPLPIYMTCTLVGQLSVGIAFIAVSLTYGAEPLAIYLENARPNHNADFLAFSVIIYLVVRSNVTKVPIPGILKTIARDATYYFLVIFTSHLVIVMFFLFVKVSTSSQSSLFSPQLTYTFVGRDQAAPLPVSDTATRFFRLFTEILPAK